jgi:hypothetical protein
VQWVSPDQAMEVGFDIAEGLTWLDATADELDIWVCTRRPDCDGGGLLPREAQVFGFENRSRPFA